MRAQFDTNVFGTLRVLQAALPLLRQQGSGRILGVSSGVGLVALPLIGCYCASKWAFEALHDSLAQEVRAFGIRVTLVEPGAYATEFGSPASLKVAPGGLEAYAPLRTGVGARMAAMDQGDPRATAAAILRLVDAEDPPLRLFLGSGNLPWVRATYADRLATWEAWAAVADAAQGNGQETAPGGPRTATAPAA